MVLKVRFILGENTFFVGGSLCNQYFCVVPFINNKLPFSNKTSIRCLVSLCLKENLRSAPKVKEAIVPLSKSVFSCYIRCLEKSQLMLRIYNLQIKLGIKITPFEYYTCIILCIFFIKIRNIGSN